MTNQPDQPVPKNLDEALVLLQADLPRVGKDKTAKVVPKDKAPYTYDYANLASILAVLKDPFGKLGLAFTSRPLTVFRDNGDREFVLAYRLVHAPSGEADHGEWPLPDPLRTSPQQVGSAISYARRYALCAVINLAPDDDDDDGQAASAPVPPSRSRGKPPERAPGNLPRNRDGQIARGKTSDDEKTAAGLMTDAQQREHSQLQRDVQGQGPQGTERLQATPADDPFYTEPEPYYEPIPVDRAQLRPPRTSQLPPARAIVVHLKRLLGSDVADSVRLEYTAALAGRTDPITSTNDLTAAEGVTVLGKLGKCKDKAALDALLEAGGPSGP